MKTCTKCKCDKELSEFYLRRGIGDGYQHMCKECQCLTVKEHRENNPEKYIQKEKERYAKDPEFYKAKSANWRKNNPNKVINYKKKWYAENREYSLQKTYEWRDNNHDQLLVNLRKANKKIRSTPKGKLNHNLSGAILHCLKTNNGSKSNRHWETLVDFTIDQLKNHLEKLFTPEMTWDNYGTYWQVDHKIPRAVFNFTRPEDIDFKICWSIKNLQPLEANENRRKSDKIDKPFQPSLALAIGG